MTLEQFPPSSVNNSRDIVSRAIRGYKKFNLAAAQKIEALTGWVVDDAGGADTGMEMEKQHD